MSSSVSSLPPPPPPLLLHQTPTPTQTHTLTLSSTEQWLFTSLKSSKTPAQFKSLHAVAVKTGLIHSHLVLGQLLLSTSIHSSYALRLFLSLPSPPTTPFLYNALLSSLSRSSFYLQTLLLYSLMRSHSIPSDPFTLPPVFRSASSLPSLSTALEAHSLSLKTNLFEDLVVRTALVDMYCSFGLSASARLIFDRTPDKDAVLWNTMIAGHTKCSEFDSARELFDRMPARNVSSYNTMVDMYCKIGEIEIARTLFDEMKERDVISWNAMISGYAKIGDYENARKLFVLMPKRNVVSWNVVITCYVHNRLFSEALDLFRSVLGSNVEANEVTVVAVLPACAHLGALDLGQWVHAYIRRHKIKMDLFVTTALIDMYGKCGSLEDAQRIFDHTTRRDAFLYNTMIEVLAMHGRAKEAFKFFDLMRGEGIRPNDVTFVALLKACAHVGLVEIGLRYFKMMEIEFGLMPKVEHFGCMVDLLGRAGRLEEAHKLILSMPSKPGPVLRASLLSSCRIHENVKLAEEVALRLIELEPESCGNYVLLSNIYSKANRWEDAAKVRKVMKEKGVLKKPGCSSIEVSNEVYEFFAGDRDHPNCREIYEMLDQMVGRLKGEGYEPCTSLALHDVGRDGREQALIHHSEKLALAFGLISTNEGSRIRIVKNLRVCDDCHVFLKLASKCYGREVVVRDCHRFHHFRDGSCSCSDYW